MDTIFDCAFCMHNLETEYNIKNKNFISKLQAYNKKHPNYCKTFVNEYFGNNSLYNYTQMKNCFLKNNHKFKEEF